MASSVIESANENFKDLDRLRKEQEVAIQKIGQIHQKIAQAAPEMAEKYGDKLWGKLRGLYMKARDLTESEVNISNTLIGQLEFLLQPGQSLSHRKKLVSEQKRKRMKADVDPTRLSSPAVSLRGPPEHSNVVVGNQVAARVTPDNADKDQWIVVKVLRFDREANKYEVLDEEPGDDEETAQRKYELTPSYIIPFPKRVDPSSAPDFSIGSQVLAVYPGTTALYKATVVGSHRKKKTDDYVLEFDDDEEDGVDGLPKRPVPFYHVVPLPEGHRQ